MKKIEVSREFLEEFEKLKQKHKGCYRAMEIVNHNRGLYPFLNAYLFDFSLAKEAVNQNEFAEVWIGKVEYVVKESLYYVKLIDKEEGYLNYRKHFDIYTLHTKEETDSVQTKFTEKEIKDIDLRYWSFSIPVEE